MSLPVNFRDLATDDVRAIHSWYEEQQDGLGSRFVTSLDLAVALVSQHPLSCPIVHRRVRRALLHGFPYALFYLLEAEVIIVLACLHQNRDTKTARKRIRSESDANR